MDHHAQVCRISTYDLKIEKPAFPPPSQQQDAKKSNAATTLSKNSRAAWVRQPIREELSQRLRGRNTIDA